MNIQLKHTRSCVIWNLAGRVALGMCTMEFLDSWDCDEFAEFLRRKGLHDVIDSIATNRIDSGLFLNLTGNDLKELAPVIGDRICLRKILEEARKVGVF